jgi:hypothetical protein
MAGKMDGVGEERGRRETRIPPSRPTPQGSSSALPVGPLPPLLAIPSHTTSRKDLRSPFAQKALAKLPCFGSDLNTSPYFTGKQSLALNVLDSQRSRRIQRRFAWGWLTLAFLGYGTSHSCPKNSSTSHPSSSTQYKLSPDSFAPPCAGQSSRPDGTTWVASMVCVPRPSFLLACGLRLSSSPAIPFPAHVDDCNLVKVFTQLICNMRMQCHDTCRSYTFLTKRRLLPNIDGVRIVGGKIALNRHIPAN